MPYCLNNPAGNRDQVTTSFTGQSNLVQDYTAGASNELVLAAGVTQSFAQGGDVRPGTASLPSCAVPPRRPLCGHGQNVAQRTGSRPGPLTGGTDLNGNLTSRGTRSFAWDHRNRLTGVNDSGSGLDWDADYDHNDRIYKRVVDGTQYDLVYDDFGRLLAEIKVNPSGADELMASYLWDGIGLAAENRGGQVRYPVYDGLGTVQLWLDEEGEVLEAPRFDEWGVPTVTSASPFGYTGRWGGFADAATGDVLNWHRWYGPMQGNWLSRDPIGVMGGENVYGYVENGPLNAIDPSGEFLVVWLLDWSGYDWYGHMESFDRAGRLDGLYAISDFAAGFGDQLTSGFGVFGDSLTSKIRDLDGTNGYVNRCSVGYGSGQLGANVWGSTFPLSGVGRAGWLLGRGGGKGLLNNNNIVRFGWGWSQRLNKEVIRLASGYKKGSGFLKHRHWLDIPWW